MVLGIWHVLPANACDWLIYVSFARDKFQARSQLRLPTSTMSTPLEATTSYHLNHHNDIDTEIFRLLGDCAWLYRLQQGGLCSQLGYLYPVTIQLTQIGQDAQPATKKEASSQSVRIHGLGITSIPLSNYLWDRRRWGSETRDSRPEQNQPERIS